MPYTLVYFSILLYISVYSYIFQYTTGGQSLPKLELAANMCAVCGQRIVLPTEDESNSGKVERTYRLGCGHLYPSY